MFFFYIACWKVAVYLIGYWKECIFIFILSCYKLRLSLSRFLDLGYSISWAEDIQALSFWITHKAVFHESKTVLLFHQLLENGSWGFFASWKITMMFCELLENDGNVPRSGKLHQCFIF